VINQALFLSPLFLCWGSFLNVVAHRLLTQESIVSKRSRCPKCHKQIAWFDLIPVISFFLLKRKCRYCHKPISWLYPFIEIITAISLSLIILFVKPHYWFASILFVSALIVNTRTDLQAMLIPRITSAYLAPIGWLCALLHLLPITLSQSIVGSIVGYMTLFLVAKLFFYATKKHGLGEGDFDLMALIGAFTGLQGIWASIFIGSIVGSIIGTFLIIIGKYSRNTKMPFGPFLALGALIHLLYPSFIFNLV